MNRGSQQCLPAACPALHSTQGPAPALFMRQVMPPPKNCSVSRRTWAANVRVWSREARSYA